jgi:hypothetical protein
MLTKENQFVCPDPKGCKLIFNTRLNDSVGQALLGWANTCPECRQV